MKHSFYAFLAVLLAVVATGSMRAETVANLPAKPAHHVSDFAGVLDAETMLSLDTRAQELHDKAHADIDVVTIKTLEGESVEQFTSDLEDKWKIGKKGEDRGVIVLFAIQDHKDRVEVGYGLEGVLNDAKVGDIQRSIVPQLRAGQYGGAITNEFTQLANDIAADANVTLTAQDDAAPTYGAQTQQPMQRQAGPHIPGFVLILIFLFVLFILRRGGGGGLLGFLLGMFMGGGFGGSGGGFGGGGGGFGGGGGDSGGGSDGGSSGGGGASGSW